MQYVKTIDTDDEEESESRYSLATDNNDISWTNQIIRFCNF